MKVNPDKRVRILYHVGKRPPRPVPNKYHGPEVAVFLTPDPIEVSFNHNRWGHVYAVEVPKSEIRRCGGVRRYDRASEVILDAQAWKKARVLGKAMDASELEEQVLRMARIERARQYRDWVNAKEIQRETQQDRLAWIAQEKADEAEYYRKWGKAKRGKSKRGL